MQSPTLGLKSIKKNSSRKNCKSTNDSIINKDNGLKCTGNTCLFGANVVFGVMLRFKN